MGSEPFLESSSECSVQSNPMVKNIPAVGTCTVGQVLLAKLDRDVALMRIFMVQGLKPIQISRLTPSC